MPVVGANGLAARAGTGFDGSIKWRDARGHRVGDRGLSSRSSDCNEIAANVAFAVAVQIQLLTTFAQTTPESSESEVLVVRCESASDGTKLVRN